MTAALDTAGESLRSIVGSADGLQTGGYAEASAHHLANVLYNVMRGGIFAQNHEVERDDFLAFLRIRNRDAAQRHVGALVDHLDHARLEEQGEERARQQQDDKAVERDLAQQKRPVVGEHLAQVVLGQLADRQALVERGIDPARLVAEGAGAALVLGLNAVLLAATFGMEIPFLAG